jgi:hypothetical protein
MDQENVAYMHNGVGLSQKEYGMWFEGKWMQSEDITLSEVSQAQKDKGRMFPLIHGRQIQKIDIHKNHRDHTQTHM